MTNYNINLPSKKEFIEQIEEYEKKSDSCVSLNGGDCEKIGNIEFGNKLIKKIKNHQGLTRLCFDFGDEKYCQNYDNEGVRIASQMQEKGNGVWTSPEEFAKISKEGFTEKDAKNQLTIPLYKLAKDVGLENINLNYYEGNKKWQTNMTIKEYKRYYDIK